jgi:hypothetical protein
MSDNSKVNITVDENYNGKPIVVHLLEGNAPKPVDDLPKSWSKSMNVTEVAGFLQSLCANKLVKPSAIAVDMNYNKGCIEAVVGFQNTIQGKIDAKLALHPEFVEWNINTNKEFTLPDFRKFLKFRGHNFSKREDHLKMLTELEKIQIKTTSTLKDDEDNAGGSGERSKKWNVEFESTLTRKWTLLMPIYSVDASGVTTKVKFEVEMKVSGEGGKAMCWLESTEANELIETQKNTYFDNIAKEIVEYRVEGEPNERINLSRLSH